MAHLKADLDRCAGHGRCSAISDELFPQDDDGRIAISWRDIDEDDLPLARDAVAACPERALSLSTTAQS
jgi:ferredoxin